MITREVREWFDKVKRGQYSYEDSMTEFVQFANYLTIEEIKLIKKRIKESYN